MKTAVITFLVVLFGLTAVGLIPSSPENNDFFQYERSLSTFCSTVSSTFDDITSLFGLGSFSEPGSIFSTRYTLLGLDQENDVYVVVSSDQGALYSIINDTTNTIVDSLSDVRFDVYSSSDEDCSYILLSYYTVMSRHIYTVVLYDRLNNELGSYTFSSASVTCNIYSSLDDLDYGINLFENPNYAGGR